MIYRSKRKKTLNDNQVLKQFTDEYCEACGAKLKVIKKKFYKFDFQSGQPEYKYLVKCPNHNYWNNFLSTLDIRDRPIHTIYWVEISVVKKALNGEQFKFVYLE